MNKWKYREFLNPDGTGTGQFDIWDDEEQELATVYDKLDAALMSKSPEMFEFIKTWRKAVEGYRKYKAGEWTKKQMEAEKISDDLLLKNLIISADEILVQLDEVK